MQLAPIVLFVYNRPWHTKETIEALRKNNLASESELIVFSDGAKNDLDEIKVREVRQYINSISGFKTVTISTRDENWGLAKSVIAGVTEVVNKHGKVIVLEDDLVTASCFLKYMNEALEMYEHEEKVISIHGYVYPIKNILPETFFIKGADCWGWATWKRGWGIFQSDGAKLLAELEGKSLSDEFDFNKSYGYSEMLKEQIRGRNNSWAVRWYASAFLKNKLTLYPGKSLIQNIGFDGEGTHADSSKVYQGELAVKIIVQPIMVEENKFARVEFENYFRSISKMGLLKKIVINLQKIFK